MQVSACNEISVASEIIPLNKLTWNNLGKVSNYTLTSSFVSQDIDIKHFAPLSYEGEPWSVSTAEKVEIKKGGKWH